MLKIIAARKIISLTLFLIGYVVLSLGIGLLIENKEPDITYIFFGPIVLFIYDFNGGIKGFFQCSIIVFPMLIAPLIKRNKITTSLCILGIIIWLFLGYGFIFLLA